MRLPTVKLWDAKKKRQIEINQSVYASDLLTYARSGRYRIIGETHAPVTDADIQRDRLQHEAELIRQRDPKAKAFGDAERAYQERAVSFRDVQTEAPPPPPARQAAPPPEETGATDPAPVDSAPMSGDPDQVTEGGTGGLKALHKGRGRYAVVDQGTGEELAAGLTREDAEAMAAGEMPLP